MGNVIDKAFAVLERIAASSPEPMLPMQLSEEFRLNRTICSRHLKQLMDMGYLLKITRRHREKILKTLKTAAEELTGKLTREYIIG